MGGVVPECDAPDVVVVDREPEAVEWNGDQPFLILENDRAVLLIVIRVPVDHS